MRTLTLILTLAVLAGCQSHITGGTTKQDNGSYHAEFPTPMGTIVIDDMRAVISTTQPSVSTNAKVLPSTTAAKPGTIGGVSFAAMPHVNRASLYIGIGLILVGAALAYFFQQRMLGAILGALGFLAAVYPLVCGIIAGGVILYAIWKVYKSKTRIVASVDNAVKAVVPAEDQPAFYDKMKESQNDSDTAAVKAIKARLPQVQLRVSPQATGA